MSEEQASYEVSYVADRPIISFDGEVDKTRLIPKSVFRFRDIVDEMAKTYEKKNHDYGNAYSEGYKLFGHTPLLSRIHEKFCRVYNLLNHTERQVLDESVLDTLTDMANQCVILRIMIENNDFENVE